MDKIESVKEYKLLINNAKDRNSGDENHHITPKIMGGTKTVDLTIEEHIKAHELLMSITFGTRYHIPMTTAYFLMCNTRYFTDKVDVEKLKYAKEQFVKRMTGKKVSKETRAKLSAARTRQMPPRPKGFKMSEEQKIKIGRSNKNNTNGRFGKGIEKIYTKESKERLIKALENRVISKKTREKLSKAAKKQWQSREA